MTETLLTYRGRAATLRPATVGDLPAVIDLLAADQLGASRDGIADGAAGEEARAAYLHAFRAIEADAGQLLMVAVDESSEIVGTFQLGFLPGLARRGAWRAQIEAVRVRADQRGSGLGAAMMIWAIEESRRRGCSLVQLTSDRSRTDAHRFYERLGFVDSHVGLKLALTPR